MNYQTNLSFIDLSTNTITYHILVNLRLADKARLARTCKTLLKLIKLSDQPHEEIRKRRAAWLNYNSIYLKIYNKWHIVPGQLDAKNVNLSLTLLEKFDLFNDSNISENINIGWQFVKDDLNNPDSQIRWDLYNFVRSHPITMAEFNDIKKYEHHPRNDYYDNIQDAMRSNEYLTAKFISDNPTFPWNDPKSLYANTVPTNDPAKNLNVKNWLANPPKPIIWTREKEDDPKLTLEIVLQNLTIKWDWFRLLNRGMITADYLFNTFSANVCKNRITMDNKLILYGTIINIVK